MKKQLKKLVALVMAGAVFVLQAAVPVQAQTLPAEESSEEVMAVERAYSYSSLGEITGNGVALRKHANLSSDIIRYLNKGHLVEVDTKNVVFAEKLYWYPCQFTDNNGNTYRGFVAKKYVKIL